jgi:hypothetical protein
MLLDQKFVRNGRLYRQDAQGNLYVWIPSNATGLGELGGLWKKIKSIHKRITKTVKRVIKAPIKLHQKVQKAILKSKFGRTLVTGAGAVFAPFTGGASLAAAQALTRYGKARYVQGLSRSDALKKGATGAAVGYVAGVGLVYGAGAIGVGPASVAGRSASFLTPFGTAAAPIVSAASPAAQTFSYAGYSVPGASTAGIAKAAAAAPSFLTKVGAFLTTAAKTAGTVLPLIQAAGGPKGGGTQEFDTAMTAAGMPYSGGYSEEYGGGGSGGGGGGPNMPPEIDPETGEPIQQPGISPAMLGVAAAGLLLFTTMGGGRRSRNRKRKGRK